jgi:hypothetical protein
MNNLLNDYGILLLVILFIAFSLYYKNFVNIGVFLVLFVAFRNMVDSKNALIYAYCVSILFGIVKNFHLLENFTSNKGTLVPAKQKEFPIADLFKQNENDENTNLNESEEVVEKKVKKSKGIKKLSKTEKKDLNEKIDAPDIGEFITEDFINKFIKRLKKEDNLLILKEKHNLYKLNPTVNKLSRNKVEKIKKKMLNDTQLAKKPIVVTNDYFILDGHHIWYAKKGIIESNTNGYNTNDIYSEDVNVVVIDYNIRKCVQKLQEYKIKYNKDYLNKNIEDINNISLGKQHLDEIKETIKNLESNYNKFASVKLV